MLPPAYSRKRMTADTDTKNTQTVDPKTWHNGWQSCGPSSQTSTPLRTFAFWQNIVTCQPNGKMRQLALNCRYSRTLYVKAYRQKVPSASTCAAKGRNKTTLFGEVGIRMGWLQLLVDKKKMRTLCDLLLLFVVYDRWWRVFEFYPVGWTKTAIWWCHNGFYRLNDYLISWEMIVTSLAINN